MFDYHVKMEPIKPQCCHCGSLLMEYSDSQEYDLAHWVSDYQCCECYHYTGYIYPKQTR